MNNNFPCECGHSEKEHHKPKGMGKIRNLGVCYHFIITQGYYTDNCNEFVPDNLKYLEQKVLDK